jgi:hypothetical protein
MSNAVTFTKPAARRISAAVKRVERMPFGGPAQRPRPSPPRPEWRHPFRVTVTWTGTAWTWSCIGVRDNAAAGEPAGRVWSPAASPLEVPEARDRALTASGWVCVVVVATPNFTFSAILNLLPSSITYYSTDGTNETWVLPVAYIDTAPDVPEVMQTQHSDLHVCCIKSPTVTSSSGSSGGNWYCVLNSYYYAYGIDEPIPAPIGPNGQTWELMGCKENPDQTYWGQQVLWFPPGTMQMYSVITTAVSGPHATQEACQADCAGPASSGSSSGSGSVSGSTSGSSGSGPAVPGWYCVLYNYTTWGTGYTEQIQLQTYVYTQELLDLILAGAYGFGWGMGSVLSVSVTNGPWATGEECNENCPYCPDCSSGGSGGAGWYCVEWSKNKWWEQGPEEEYVDCVYLYTEGEWESLAPQFLGSDPVTGYDVWGYPNALIGGPHETEVACNATCALPSGSSSGSAPLSSGSSGGSSGGNLGPGYYWCNVYTKDYPNPGDRCTEVSLTDFACIYSAGGWELGVCVDSPLNSSQSVIPQSFHGGDATCGLA